MLKKIVFISLFFILAAAWLAPNALTLTVQAQTQLNTLEGLNQTAGQVDAFKDQAKPGKEYGSDFLASKVGQIIGIILSFVGVLFFILMIYAGITWMTAQGNEQQVAKAKTLLINAVIGIIIVFAAYAVTSFIGTEILK